MPPEVFDKYLTGEKHYLDPSGGIISFSGNSKKINVWTINNASLVEIQLELNYEGFPGTKIEITHCSVETLEKTIPSNSDLCETYTVRTNESGRKSFSLLIGRAYYNHVSALFVEIYPIHIDENLSMTPNYSLFGVMQQALYSTNLVDETPFIGTTDYETTYRRFCTQNFTILVTNSVFAGVPFLSTQQCDPRKAIFPHTTVCTLHQTWNTLATAATYVDQKYEYLVEIHPCQILVDSVYTDTNLGAQNLVNAYFEDELIVYGIVHNNDGDMSIVRLSNDSLSRTNLPSISTDGNPILYRLISRAEFNALPGVILLVSTMSSINVCLVLDNELTDFENMAISPDNMASSKRCHTIFTRDDGIPDSIIFGTRPSADSDDAYVTLMDTRLTGSDVDTKNNVYLYRYKTRPFLMPVYGYVGGLAIIRFSKISYVTIHFVTPVFFSLERGDAGVAGVGVGIEKINTILVQRRESDDALEFDLIWHIDSEKNGPLSYETFHITNAQVTELIGEGEQHLLPDTRGAILRSMCTNCVDFDAEKRAELVKKHEEVVSANGDMYPVTLHMMKELHTVYIYATMNADSPQLHTEAFPIAEIHTHLDEVGVASWSLIQASFGEKYVRDGSESTESFTMPFISLSMKPDFETSSDSSTNDGSNVISGPRSFEIPLEFLAAEIRELLYRVYVGTPELGTIEDCNTMFEQYETLYNFKFSTTHHAYCERTGFMPRIAYMTYDGITHHTPFPGALDLGTPQFQIFSSGYNSMDLSSFISTSAFDGSLDMSIVKRISTPDRDIIFDLASLVQQGTLKYATAIEQCMPGYTNLAYHDMGTDLCSLIPEGFYLDTKSKTLEMCPTTTNDNEYICPLGNTGPVKNTEFPELSYLPSHALSLKAVGTGSDAEEELTNQLLDMMMNPLVVITIVGGWIAVLMCIPLHKMFAKFDRMTEKNQNDDSSQHSILQVFGGYLTILSAVGIVFVILTGISLLNGYSTQEVYDLKSFRESYSANTFKQCQVFHTSGVSANSMVGYNNVGKLNLDLYVSIASESIIDILLNPATYVMSGCMLDNRPCSEYLADRIPFVHKQIRYVDSEDQNNQIKNPMVEVFGKDNYTVIHLSEIIMSHPSLSDVESFEPSLSNEFMIEITSTRHMPLANLRMTIDNGDLHEFTVNLATPDQEIQDDIRELSFNTVIYRTSIYEATEKKTSYIPIHQIMDYTYEKRESDQLIENYPLTIRYSFERSNNIVHCEFSPIVELSTLILAVFLISFTVWELIHFLATFVPIIVRIFRQEKRNLTTIADPSEHIALLP